jgi:hypothetical protein
VTRIGAAGSTRRADAAGSVEATAGGSVEKDQEYPGVGIATVYVVDGAQATDGTNVYRPVLIQ